MSQVLTPKQRDSLRAMGVELVYLFGSCAEGTSHTLSDVDIGVVFDENFLPRDDSRAAYNELYDIFTDVFPEKNVDIVFLQRAGLELSLDAITHGKVLFESSEGKRFDFEERVILLYADFKPLLDEFNRAVLDRIE